MKKWAKYSMIGGAILILIALVWSIATGNPVWSEFFHACEDSCTLFGNPNGN